MSDDNPRPSPDDDGVTLSPDAPIGEPVPHRLERPQSEPPPNEGGIIGPGPTPESR